MRRRLKTLAANPWLALLLLNALFLAPAVGEQLLVKPWALLQPSGDLLLLVLLSVAATRWRYGIWVRRVAVLAGVVLWVYLLDELVATLIIRKAPPLYDQVYLVRHVGVLLLDLMNWALALALVGVVVALILATALGRRLIRTTVEGFSARPLRKTAPVGAALMLLIGTGTIVDHARLSSKRRKPSRMLIRWTTPDLVANLQASFRMHRDLQEGIDHSPYAEYQKRYTLTRKPDVHLFLVESYGRLLLADPEAGPRWKEQITAIQARLDASGWHAVTGFSQAPISGGRSWLAEATLLTGVFVRFEAMFQHLMAQMEDAPNLVAFLDAQGYETVLLAPKDRPRPGVVNTNHYRYDQQVLALDLEYDGPAYGWGVIPDQYSLGFAHDNVFENVDGPIFTNFHMVSSHAPWKSIPPLVDDWGALARMDLPEDAEPFPFPTPRTELITSARRYAAKKNNRYVYEGYVDAVKIDAYAASIQYCLELLTGYLEGLDGDKLVLIMGDHQPPLISRDDESHDVPIHILSRDPALLQEFRNAGFVDGLFIDKEETIAVAHEGMFSLLVRALVGCCSEGDAELPPHVSDGVQPGRRRGRRG